MQSFLTSLATSIAPTIGGIVIIMALSIAAVLYQNLEQRLPANVRAQLDALARMVVAAIEQKYGTTLPGATKKQEALNTLAAIAASLGLKIDAIQADAAIEAAVFALRLLQAQATSGQKIPASIGVPNTQDQPGA